MSRPQRIWGRLHEAIIELTNGSWVITIKPFDPGPVPLQPIRHVFTQCTWPHGNGVMPPCERYSSACFKDRVHLSQRCHGWHRGRAVSFAEGLLKISDGRRPPRGRRLRGGNG